LALLFSMQGVGRIFCNIVLLVLLQNDPHAYDSNWRIAVALGALPAVVALYFRFTMTETEPFSAYGSRAAAEARAAQSLGKEPPSAFQGCCQAISDNFMLLLGTAGSWFILDVTFYGNSLFSGDVTQAMGIAETPMDEAWQNLYLNLLAMPGYVLAIVMMDYIGRCRLQWLGFAGVGAVFLGLGLMAEQLKLNPSLYIVAYALTFFLSDFGPNTTTFVIAATVFPTSSRSTCAGISAAVGKLGAVMGGLLFKPIEVAYGIEAVFMSCAAVSFFGALWTIALVTDKESETLDEGYVEDYVGEQQ